MLVNPEEIADLGLPVLQPGMVSDVDLAGEPVEVAPSDAEEGAE